MEPPTGAEDPYGSAIPAPLPADAELGPYDSPVVDAVEVVEALSRHLQVEPGR